jgi:hypothetical protein
MIQSWQIDDLPKTMDLLHSWLQRAYDKPLVIYVHCEVIYNGPYKYISAMVCAIELF